MALPRYAMNQSTFPQMYERELVGCLFRPWAELTLDEVGLSSGDRILDVACGTGIVARTALNRLGSGRGIVGIDISADMLAVASAVAPEIDWREGNAADLPLGPDEGFDVVICQQGLQFVADPTSAVGELRRALAPGGRLAVSTWRSDEEMPFLRELRRIAEHHVGPVADKRYALGDGAKLETLLLAAGFDDVASSTRSRTVRFEDGAIFVRMNAIALVGMSREGMAMAEGDRQQVLETIVENSIGLLERTAESRFLAIDFASNLATATA